MENGQAYGFLKGSKIGFNTSDPTPAEIEASKLILKDCLSSQIKDLFECFSLFMKIKIVKFKPFQKIIRRMWRNW